MDDRPARTRRQRLNRAGRSDKSPEPEAEPEKAADAGDDETAGATRRRTLRRRHHDQHPDYIAPEKEEPKVEEAAASKEPSREPSRERSEHGGEAGAARRRQPRRSREPSREPSRRPSKEDIEEVDPAHAPTEEKEAEKAGKPEPSKKEKKEEQDAKPAEEKVEPPPRRQRRPRRRNADDSDSRSEASVRSEATEASARSGRRPPPPPSEIQPADEDVEQEEKGGGEGDEEGEKKGLGSAQASAQATPEAGSPRSEEAGEGGRREILEVLIHGTDELKAQMYLIHPVVKLSILDTEDDGRYMKKPDRTRCVVSQYENVAGPLVAPRPTPSAEPAKAEGEKEKGKEKKEGEDGEKEKAGEGDGGGKEGEGDEHISNPAGEAGTGEQRETVMYDRILPVMTAPFDLTAHLKEGHPLCCEWEEALCLDERLASFLHHRYLFLFEIMDFVHTRDSAAVTLKHLTKHGGWRKVAWAFLRPNKEGEGGYVRVGQRLRLQLYKYRTPWFGRLFGGGEARQDTSEAWGQWKRRGRTPYKATLSVTIRGMERPGDKVVQQRARMPWEREEGESELALRLRKKESQEKRQAGAVQQQGKALDQTRLGRKWIGATGKWCRVPNTLMHRLETDYRGCFVVAFSTFGTFLACAVAGHRRYKIRIFNVANGSEVKTLEGHYEIVYDMQWGMETEEIVGGLEEALSGKQREEKGEGKGGAEEGVGEERVGAGAVGGPLLLSASADTTARVWRVEKAELLASCHHPSYVYAARFCAGPDGVKGETQVEKALSGCQFVVTGCYDSNLRLWDVRPETVGDSAHAQIVKLVEGHVSHINSVVLDSAMTRLYSADGVGAIRVWSLARHSFDIIKEVEEPEVKGDAINCLRLDRSGKRLVLLARDNMIRMLDTERWQITQRFSGLRASLHQIRCDLSPDGKLLMSGSEDGQVLVWNTDTGEQEASVPRERMPHVRGLCTDVAWNPAERIIACCSFSRKHPVLVHKYERDADMMAVEEMAEDEVRDVLQGQFSELAEAFKRMDKSGDGKLQLDEFRDGVMSLESEVTEMQIFRMFKTVAGGADEIELEDFIRRFAPAGTAEELRTNTAIEKARRRHSQTKDTISRRTATLGLLEELSSDRRGKRVDGGAVGEPTETGHRRQLPPIE